MSKFKLYSVQDLNLEYLHWVIANSIEQAEFLVLQNYIENIKDYPNLLTLPEINLDIRIVTPNTKVTLDFKSMLITHTAAAWLVIYDSAKPLYLSSMSLSV